MTRVAVFRDSGTGAIDAHVKANDVDIADAGSYFTGTDVEAALQELGAAGGGGGGGIGSTELVYRYTVTGTDKASIDTGVDTPDAGSNDWTNGDLLEVSIYHRTDEAVHDGSISVTLNNDTGSNYDRQTLFGNNASAGAAASLAQSAWALQTKGASADANFFAGSEIKIPNYAGTVGYKIANARTDRIETSAGECEMDAHTLAYRSTSAISRLKVTPTTSAKKLKVGSQLLIYKRVAS